MAIPNFHCFECGALFSTSADGITNHLTENGDIDYDKDADHVPYGEEEEQTDNEKPPELVSTRDLIDRIISALEGESGAFIATIANDILPAKINYLGDDLYAVS